MRGTSGQSQLATYVDRIRTARRAMSTRDETKLSLQRGNLVIEPGEILGQRGVVGRLSFEPRDDVPALPEYSQRAVVSALS